MALRKVILIMAVALFFLSACQKAQTSSDSFVVVDIFPADGATSATSRVPIFVRFSQTANSSTVTTNSLDTVCSGSIQLSADGWTECVPLTNPVSTNGRTFQVLPLSDLELKKIYRIKVTANVENPLNAALQTEYVSSGFTRDTRLLVSIALAPENATKSLGSKMNFQAIGTFADSSTDDLSEQMHWTSSDESVATVDLGVMTLNNLGTTKIAARDAYLDIVSNEATLTVTLPTLASIVIEPESPTISVGGSQQFDAKIKLGDMVLPTPISTDYITWFSNDSTIARISNLPSTKGIAEGVSPGTVVITASLTGDATDDMDATTDLTNYKDATTDLTVR